ncbi:heterodisulfide reductase-related iron-sulfur binding cluster [Streptomyces sp. NBC_01334]|uniref:heterodisulfide reductase-related iron-sulfur binding cluster n=1 Tax=Streptomyces sp. NBC_01334 TaxID=2903827 RepID=UPI003FA3BB6B
MARASARAAATVVLPVPPLPLTTWSLLTSSSVTIRRPRQSGCCGQGGAISATWPVERALGRQRIQSAP